MVDSSGHWLMDWALTAQATATTVAVLFAGMWAVWRVWSFRELKGFLVITQAVSHTQKGWSGASTCPCDSAQSLAGIGPTRKGLLLHRRGQTGRDAGVHAGGH